LNQYEILDEKYWKRHDYLLYVYDIIADMIRQADQKKLVKATVEIDNEEKAKEFEKTEDIFRWMDENGLHNISLRLFTSHMFFSLLKDFCYFMYESISCSERGKVTVAYSLLRKPIRDNLLYLEWLLYDNEEFYNTFMYNSVEELDISDTNVFPHNRIRQIVKSAASKTYIGNKLNNDDLIYLLRFESKDTISLQRIWNQSTHLITTRSRFYRTQSGNINFLFADEEIWNDFWNYYYICVPHLIAYAIEICEAIFLSIHSVDNINQSINRFIRTAKYIDAISNVDSSNSTEFIANMIEETNQLINRIKSFRVNIYIPCEVCSSNITLHKELLIRLVESLHINCEMCGSLNYLGRYFTDVKIDYGKREIK